MEEDDVWAACARAIAAARRQDPLDLAGRRGTIAELLFAPLTSLPPPPCTHQAAPATSPKDDQRYSKSAAQSAQRPSPPISPRPNYPPLPMCSAGSVTPLSRGPAAPPAPLAVPPKTQEQSQHALHEYILHADEPALQNLEARALALTQGFQYLLALTHDGPELDDDHQRLHASNALQALEAAMVFDDDDAHRGRALCSQAMVQDMVKGKSDSPPPSQCLQAERLFCTWAQGLPHRHTSAKLDPATNSKSGALISHGLQSGHTKKLQVKAIKPPTPTPTATPAPAPHHPSLVQRAPTSRISTASIFPSSQRQQTPAAQKSTTAAPSSTASRSASGTLKKILQGTTMSAYEDKLEATKRKLHLGYERAQEAKRQHTICVLRSPPRHTAAHRPMKPSMRHSVCSKGTSARGQQTFKSGRRCS